MTTENGSPSASPAAPAAPAPAPRKTAPAMRTKTAFEQTNAATPMDRLKAYLKDVPVLHQRLTSVVTGLEQNLDASKKTLAEFEATTAQIKATVARWEEEQSHVGSAAGKPAVPAPAEPAGGDRGELGSPAPAAPAGAGEPAAPGGTVAG